MRKVIVLDSKNSGPVRSNIEDSLIQEELVLFSALDRKVNIIVILKFPDGSEASFSFGDE